MLLDFLMLMLLFTVGVAASFAVVRLGRIVTLLERIVGQLSDATLRDPTAWDAATKAEEKQRGLLQAVSKRWADVATFIERGEE